MFVLVSLCCVVLPSELIARPESPTVCRKLVRERGGG
jgi:hypothetical protein